MFLGKEISQSRDYSEKTAIMIDEEVRSLVEGAYNKAKQLLSDNMDKLHVIALALLERESLDGDDLEKLLRGEKLEPLPRGGDHGGLSVAADAPVLESGGKKAPAPSAGLRPSENPGPA